MKTIKNLSLLLFILFTSQCLLSAQSDSVYYKAMAKNLEKVAQSQTVADLQQCRNQFERIGQKYADQWLPVYYVAYCDIQMVYYDVKSDNNAAILTDADSFIKKLDKYKQADKSEVETLKGYYYTVMIAQNPAVNGQKYYAEVVAAYRKAIELNAENPRPVCLLTFFEQNLPEFLGRTFSKEEGKAKAIDLFAKEDKNTLSPRWGEYMLQMIK